MNRTEDMNLEVHFESACVFDQQTDIGFVQTIDKG